MPYVKEGGFFVAYKSGRVKEELMEGKKQYLYWEESWRRQKNFSFREQIWSVPL